MLETKDRAQDVAVTGDSVFVVDEYGKLHNGLVTNGWGAVRSCLNVIFVSEDKTKVDQYGTQLERLSSCSHRDDTEAPGRYWFKSGEKKA